MTDKGPKLFFYKREPALFLNGIAHMTCEQITVYTVLLELMYDKWEPVSDRAPKQRRDLAKRCGLSVRKFGTTLDELLAADKLQRTLSGRLSNRKFESLAHHRGVDTAATFDKIPKKALDNRGDNRADNEGGVNDSGGLDPENTPTRGRDELEVRSQKPESSSGDQGQTQESGLFEETMQLIDSDITRICTALGIDFQSTPGAHNWPAQWNRLRVEKDVTVEDMIAAIESYGAPFTLSRMKSIWWLKDRAIEKRVARKLNAAILARSGGKRAAVASTITDDQWREKITLFINTGAWAPSNGPSPLEPGPHLAPESMLVNAQRYWEEQGNHPRRMHHGGTAVPWEPGKEGPVLKVTPFAPRK